MCCSDNNDIIHAEYFFGPGIDQPLFEIRDDVIRHYYTDAQGNVIQVAGKTKSDLVTYRYDSFGRPLAATGLYYYRARYYDPSLGRFLTEDPIGLASGDAHRYRYVGNNPLRWVDPWGLLRWNAPPPRTVPVRGQTLANLQCVEGCLQRRTGNANLDLLINGGAEQFGHSRNSHHYRGEACDIAGPRFNPVPHADVMQCAHQCGFGAGHFEDSAGSAHDHWHLQRVPGNGVPALPNTTPTSESLPQGGQ
ncbi:MAG: RHS repeat-associated core domain-containing protein [Deltaproteobacteria bacterium]|nr:RHS repeat-associated core domain-containing protein [Deltaproteobacteria bacterium]